MKYIGNTQHTLKIRIDDNLSYVNNLIKNGQNPDSFTAHNRKFFYSTMSWTDLRMFMYFKVVNKFNPIYVMKNKNSL